MVPGTVISRNRRVLSIALPRALTPAVSEWQASIKISFLPGDSLTLVSACWGTARERWIWPSEPKPVSEAAKKKLSWLSSTPWPARNRSLTSYWPALLRKSKLSIIFAAVGFIGVSSVIKRLFTLPNRLPSCALKKFTISRASFTAKSKSSKTGDSYLFMPTASIHRLGKSHALLVW